MRWRSQQFGLYQLYVRKKAAAAAAGLGAEASAADATARHRMLLVLLRFLGCATIRDVCVPDTVTVRD